jgi:transcriptional regulator with XRE-family HTH domain
MAKTPEWRKKLRELMSLEGMTQSKLSLELDVSPITVWRLLREEGREPKLRVYQAIERLHAEAFGD